MSVVTFTTAGRTRSTTAATGSRPGSNDVSDRLPASAGSGIACLDAVQADANRASARRRPRMNAERRDMCHRGRELCGTVRRGRVRRTAARSRIPGGVDHSRLRRRSMTARTRDLVGGMREQIPVDHRESAYLPTSIEPVSSSRWFTYAEPIVNPRDRRGEVEPLVGEEDLAVVHAVGVVGGHLSGSRRRASPRAGRAWRPTSRSPSRAWRRGGGGSRTGTATSSGARPGTGS